MDVAHDTRVLVSSIEAVAGVVETSPAQVRSPALSHNTPASLQLELLASIRNVADLSPRKKDKPEPTRAGSDPAMLRALHSTAHAFVVSAPRKQIAPARGAQSVWDMVGRTRDERHCSDILAALLNPFMVGPAAKELFCSLMAFGLGRPELKSDGIEYQVVYREYGLERLRMTGERRAGRGRIDIFARTNNGILTIENKIDAPEGLNQTLRYVDAVESRYRADARPRSYLLLSSFPFIAGAREFQGIQYPALFDMLRGLRSDPGWNRRGQGLLRLFLDEIGSVFLAPIMTAIDNSSRHLRKAGYEV